ncbi:MAG: protease complex subunit PrcB family protein [Lachnospiraceae bacterium]|nr:protease complex subunit PrcB family protein [Lachnospiraceae bacterium]
MSKKMRRIGIVLLLATIVCFTGCKEEEKIRDLDFTVVSSECIPEELLSEIETKKQEEFKLTFRDGNYLYLCVGYGAKETGGYSICVKDLYLTDSSIVLDTTLLGPKHTENNKAAHESFPYIVIKMEFIDAVVIFS